MNATREYPCLSEVRGDKLRVWADGTGFGFQTTNGHTAFLNPRQIQNLVKVLTGKEEIGSAASPPPLWRDVT